jgi:hypothetical protein
LEKSILRNGAAIDSKGGGDFGGVKAVITANPTKMMITIPSNHNTHVVIFIFYRAPSICFSPAACFIATAEVSLEIYILFGL